MSLEDPIGSFSASSFRLAFRLALSRFVLSRGLVLSPGVFQSKSHNDQEPARRGCDNS